MKRVLIAFVLLALPPSSAFASNCSIQQFRFVFGSDSDASMVVKSGSPCFVHINARASITSASIGQNATSGTASIQSSHSWEYQSRAGFSGQDRFVVEISGTSFSGRDGRLVTSGTSKVRFDVKVTP